MIPPAIRGLGVSGGFQLQILDKENAGPPALFEHAQELIGQAEEQPEIGPLTTTFRPGVPQVEPVNLTTGR